MDAIAKAEELIRHYIGDTPEAREVLEGLARAGAALRDAAAFLAHGTPIYPGSDVSTDLLNAS